MTERVLPAPAAIDLSKLIRAGDTVIWGQACAVAHPDHRDALAAVPSGPGESRTAITTRSPSGKPVT